MMRDALARKRCLVEGCKAYACFGKGRLGDLKAMVWACRAHRAKLDERPKALLPQVMQAAHVAATKIPAQGRLL